MRDALKWSKAPLIFSHSNARAIYNVSRNAPDDVLNMLKENEGLIMVNSYPGFVGEFKYVGVSHSGSVTNLTVKEMADHVEYISNVIGWQYVGVGSDFDGIETVLNDLQDVSMYPNLYNELSSRGFTEEMILGIKGQNFLRVMRAMEKVSIELQNEGKIDESWMPKEDLTFKEERVQCRTDTELHPDAPGDTTPDPQPTSTMELSTTPSETTKENSGSMLSFSILVLILTFNF